MKYSLFDEIHLFHTSNIYISEYPTKARQLRVKINEELIMVEKEFLCMKEAAQMLWLLKLDDEYIYKDTISSDERKWCNEKLLA